MGLGVGLGLGLGLGLGIGLGSGLGLGLGLGLKPGVHQSTASSKGLPLRTSGARYSGVPKG